MAVTIGEAKLTVDGKETTLAELIAKQQAAAESAAAAAAAAGDDSGKGAESAPGSSDGGDGSDGEDGEDGDGDEVEVGPNGFPLNTPVKDMSLEHQVAYWKHQNRKAEQRYKKEKPADGGAGSGSDALDAAREAGRAEGLAIAAEIELARQVGVDPEDLKPLMGALKSDALVAEGAIDAEAVAAIAALVRGAESGTGDGGKSNEPVAGMAAFNSAGGGIPSKNKVSSIKAAREREQARIAGLQKKGA